MKLTKIVVLTLTSLLLLCLNSQAQDQATQLLLKTVRPQADEDAFDKIPWLTSLWDARIKAAKEGKPILIWEMDGHPLGCG
jgi:hypothetical protein